MNDAQIRITCRQLLDNSSTGVFSRQVLSATFAEFQLKSQAYNPEGRFHTFREMVGNDGRANSLHYKLYFVAAPYLELLEKKMPHMCDMLEKPLPFERAELQLVASDLRDATQHRIALHYHTPLFLLRGHIGDNLILALPELPEHTFMLRLRMGVSISHYNVEAPLVAHLQASVL